MQGKVQGYTLVFACLSRPDKVPHQSMAALWLSRQGYDVIYVGPGEANERVIKTPFGNVKTECVDTTASVGSLRWHLEFASTLFRLRRRKNGKAIFYLQGGPVCPAAHLALLGYPSELIVYHTQDYLEPGRHPHWEFFERRVARRAGAVISNERNRARFLQSHYRLEKPPLVVRTALPKAWPAPERSRELRTRLLQHTDYPGKETDCRLIMAGGSFSPVRCSEQVIKAMKRLPDNYVLVFTGMKGDSEQVRQGKQLLSEMGVRDRTILLGFLDYDELLRHYASSDVGVLLYPDDGIGNFYQCPGRLTEYLISGLPFVTSNFPGLELICCQHGVGVACDPGSPDAIARAIEQLGDRDERLRRQESQRLRALAKNEFAYENQAWKIRDIVEQAI